MYVTSGLDHLQKAINEMTEARFIFCTRSEMGSQLDTTGQLLWLQKKSVA